MFKIILSTYSTILTGITPECIKSAAVKPFLIPFLHFIPVLKYCFKMHHTSFFRLHLTYFVNKTCDIFALYFNSYCITGPPVE